MEQAAPKLNPVTPEDVEASFKSSLSDAIDIIEKMAPHYESVEELVESLRLALENNGQLRLLMGKWKKKR